MAPRLISELTIDLSTLFILFNPAKFAYVFTGNYELVSLLLETPSGFAIFSMYGHHFNNSAYVVST